MRCGSASHCPEEKNMKKLVLFVQPRKSRQAKFMEFYRRGYVLQWATDVTEARQVVSSIFDWVILDLNLEPQAAQSLCAEMKGRLSSTKVALIEAPGVKLATDLRPDALVPPGVPTDALLDRLTMEPAQVPAAVVAAKPQVSRQRAHIA
jgi:CheY-like chemotaxis protein